MSRRSQSALDKMEVLLMRLTGECEMPIEARSTQLHARCGQQNDADNFGMERAYTVEEYCVGRELGLVGLNLS